MFKENWKVLICDTIKKKKKRLSSDILQNREILSRVFLKKKGKRKNIFVVILITKQTKNTRVLERKNGKFS